MAEEQVAVFEIKQYMVIWRQLEERDFDGVNAKIRGIVRCIGDEYGMDVFFLAPDSEFPTPVVDLEGKTGGLFMPVSDLAAFVDILRNEKPIYGHLRGDFPHWTSVTTTNEPVGTGDEDHI